MRLRENVLDRSCRRTRLEVSRRKKRCIRRMFGGVIAQLGERVGIIVVQARKEVAGEKLGMAMVCEEVGVARVS